MLDQMQDRIRRALYRWFPSLMVRLTRHDIARATKALNDVSPEEAELARRAAEGIVAELKHPDRHGPDS